MEIEKNQKMSDFTSKPFEKYLNMTNSWKQDQEGNVFSVQQELISQIVKEQDEYTTKIIEDWATSRGAIGTIIPEGKLKHILNLGLTTYNSIQKEPRKMLARDYFPETEYVEYFNGLITKLHEKNQKLQERVDMLERLSGLRSTDVNLE